MRMDGWTTMETRTYGGFTSVSSIQNYVRADRWQFSRWPGGRKSILRAQVSNLQLISGKRDANLLLASTIAPRWTVAPKNIKNSLKNSDFFVWQTFTNVWNAHKVSSWNDTRGSHDRNEFVFFLTTSSNVILWWNFASFKMSRKIIFFISFIFFLL